MRQPPLGQKTSQLQPPSSSRVELWLVLRLPATHLERGLLLRAMEGYPLAYPLPLASHPEYFPVADCSPCMPLVLGQRSPLHPPKSP